MNQNVLLGPTELLGAGSIAREVLAMKAVGGSAVISNVVFMFPATPANAGVLTGCTLATGDDLTMLKSCTIASGVVHVVYRH